MCLIFCNFLLLKKNIRSPSIDVFPKRVGFDVLNDYPQYNSLKKADWFLLHLSSKGIPGNSRAIFSRPLLSYSQPSSNHRFLPMAQRYRVAQSNTLATTKFACTGLCHTTTTKRTAITIRRWVRTYGRL